MGHACSSETRAKIGAANRGRRHTLEARAAISVALRGNHYALGKHPSEEVRLKMSLAHRGRPCPHGGHPCSVETRTKIAESKRGKPRSVETRAKVSATLRGRRLSPEHRAKLSAAQRGKPRPWLRGKHPSPETRAKLSASHCGIPRSAEWRAHMSAAHKGKNNRLGKHSSVETCARISAALLGHAVSTEARTKMSLSHQRLWQNREFRDRCVQAIIKANQVRPTAPERTMQSILDRRFPGEWRYTGNGDFIVGGKNPDFVNVNGRKAVIEVFGNWWHSEQKTGRTSEQEVATRQRHFADWGYDCAVIWEREVTDEDAVLAKLSKELALSQRGSS
jgi:G:T-mismatch repair DNA endonuclease (very short patch repair protein)